MWQHRPAKCQTRRLPKHPVERSHPYHHKNRLGATAVVDDNQSVLGIVTDGDIRRMLENHNNFENLTANDIMGKNPITVTHDAMATEVAALMQEKKITQIIVTQQSIYFGVVHLHDLYREGIL